MQTLPQETPGEEMMRYGRQGKDWHGWAWKAGSEWPCPGELFEWAENKKPKDKQPESSGKWVRVRFVEVKPKRQEKKRA